VYLIVGRGPMEGRLRALAGEMGVGDRVVFCGFVPETELLAYYQASEVFAMPNREVEGDIEGFGIVFVEAGACGKPVIGGRSAGAREVIADGVTGFLVNPRGVREIARTLTALLRDRDLAVRMGQAGRRRVEQNYSYQQVAGNIAAFLRKTSAQS
jgi:phosphatidylinositol alpha-1,6-mannosyltransferase